MIKENYKNWKNDRRGSSPVGMVVLYAYMAFVSIVAYDVMTGGFEASTNKYLFNVAQIERPISGAVNDICDMKIVASAGFFGNFPSPTPDPTTALEQTCQSTEQNWAR